jgi:hypothetical protein
MSTESSLPSSDCNTTTESPSALTPTKLEASFHQETAADAASSERIDDDRCQIDQDLFEKQALEQRTRLERVLRSSTPHFQDLQDVGQTPNRDVTPATRNDNQNNSILGFPLSDVWKARLLLLAAAALYGTNFSLVKILGDTMPVAISGTLRFGMASLVTLPWLLSSPPVPEASRAVHGHQVIAAVDGNNAPVPKRNWWDDLVLMVTGHNKPAQQAALAAALAGFEVGMWNSVGYVAQAVGLETTAASKVSCCPTVIKTLSIACRQRA